MKDSHMAADRPLTDPALYEEARQALREWGARRIQNKLRDRGEVRADAPHPRNVEITGSVIAVDVWGGGTCVSPRASGNAAIEDLLVEILAVGVERGIEREREFHRALDDAQIRYGDVIDRLADL